ncbi:MAG TPA: hypothetical protein VGL65_06980 [Gemmatimonadales bacterium]|jgi:hypothetical protein
MSTPTDRDVAEARRALRALLSRRDFVAASAVAGAGLLGLSACSSDSSTGPGGGGGGNTTMPNGAQSVTGSVTLPAGSTLKPSDLSVDIFTQTIPVSASGGFTVGIPPNGPSLALLVDKNGDGVLMAMFDPANASHAISPRTTAVSLLFYAANAYLFPPAAMSQILALVDGDPAVAALDAAVATAVAADPQALANGAAAIAPAVTQALQTILGTASSASAPITPSARMMDPIPTLMLLTPSDAQDGVMVSQDATTTSLLISNTKRRPCRVYVYEVTMLTGNVTTDILPAKLVQGPFDLDSTENLSLFTSLKDFTTFFHGTSPWSPINLPAIPLQLATGTDRTTYQVIVLAAALKQISGDAFEPTFFRDPHFANEVAQWRVDDANLFYTSVIGDMLLPILCFFGSFGAIVASRSAIASVIATASAARDATFVATIAQLENGSLGQLAEGLASMVRYTISSNIATTYWLKDVGVVIGQAESRALAAQSAVAAQSRLLKGSKMFLSVFEPIFAAGLILDGFDLGAVITDVYNSDIGASWTALLIRQLLNLSPANPTVSSGERVVFKVSNPANTPGGEFVYDWTQTSLFSTLSAEGEVNVGNAITTSQTTVDLVTTTADVTPINVLVVGYDTSSGQRVEIGRAGTTVNFLLPAEITPTGRVASVGDQVVFVVAVSGGIPSGASFRWTLTGTGGTIGDTNVVTTSQPSVTWTAQTTGQTDLLHVDVMVGTTLVAKADVSVSVAGPPIIDFTIAGAISGGPFTMDTQLPTGHYQFTPVYVGTRAPSPDTGLDGIYMAYDLVGSPSNESPGVSIVILLPSGVNPVAGQVLTKWTDEGHANQFQIDVSTNLINPNDSNASYGAPVGTGTLTVNAISQQNNGEWILHYAFQVIADSGGTIIGTGVGKWGASGVVVTS